MKSLTCKMVTGVMVVGMTLTAQAHAGGDPAAGRALSKQCSVCHGKTGIANDPEVANLAGQSAFYLEKALKDYRSGAREDRRMTLIAKPLDDKAIEDLAAWYASIEVEVTVPE